MKNRIFIYLNWCFFVVLTHFYYDTLIRRWVNVTRRDGVMDLSDVYNLIQTEFKVIQKEKESICVVP